MCFRVFVNRVRSISRAAYQQLRKKTILSDSSNLLHCDNFSAVASYLEYYRKVLVSLSRRGRAETMRRTDKMDEECETFLDRTEEESKRNFMNVNSVRGRIEITPIQALNLPQSERPVYVQLSYGDETFKTFSAPATAHPIWHVVEQPAMKVPTGGNTESARMSVNLSGGAGGANSRSIPENLTASFAINTVSVNGNIGVFVVQEMFSKRKKICRLSIPVFSLLDCICDISPYAYDRWFPLRNSMECRPTDGDMGTSMSAMYSEKLYSNMFEYHPCIRLSIRWVPANPNAINRRVSTLYGRLQLPSLSVSIIDSSRAREIMQAVINDIEGRHAESTELSETSVIVNWLQVDNQLPDPVSPVMLSPASVPRPLPTIRLHVVKNNALSHEHLDSFDRLDLDIQVLDLHLEQQTVVAVWDFIRIIRRDMAERRKESVKHAASSSQRHRTVDERTHNDDTGLPSTAAAGDADIDKIYIDHFRISTIMFNISFIMNPQALSSRSDSNRSVTLYQDVNASAGESSIDEHSSLHQFMWQVGEVVLDLTSTIQDAPIRLRDITVDHLFKTWGEVRSILQDHYLNSALGQMYRIVGSLDLVVNPIHLLSSLSTGVVDFIYEPLSALYNSPTEISEIGKGVMRGAVSLASHTADGLIGTATTMTRSVGKGVAALTMDEVFLRNRERLNKNPETLGSHMIRPVKDVANGVYCGIVGVVRVPYHGAKRNGVIGFVGGVAKGIAGIAAKPVVGVLDALTHTGEGVRYGMKYLKEKRGAPARKRRHSNVFGPDGRLMPYSYTTAYGAHSLRLLGHEHWERSGASTRGRLLLRSESSRKRMSGVEVYMSTQKSGRGTWETSASRMLSTPSKKSKRNLTSPSKSKRDIQSPDTEDAQVSMTESSQFSFIPVRRQSTSMTGTLSTELYQLEAVIYTAVINRGVGFDQLVVVTTLRVVVCEFRRDKSDTSVGVAWQCKLGNLRKAVFKRSSGGTVTLYIVAKTQDTNVRNQGSTAGESTYSVNGDYDVLRQLYNCLNTLLHEFDILIPMYEGDDTWEEDENNVIRIGSWHYIRPSTTLEDDDDDKDMSKAHPTIMEALGECEWIVIEPDYGAKNTPNWLMDERYAAVMAHSLVAEYKRKGTVREDDTANVAHCKEMLLSGLVTIDEYEDLISKEEKGRDMCEPNPTTCSLSQHQSEPTAFPKQFVKIIRNSYRRTFSRRTTASEDDEQLRTTPNGQIDHSIFASDRRQGHRQTFVSHSSASLSGAMTKRPFNAMNSSNPVPEEDEEDMDNSRMRATSDITNMRSVPNIQEEPFDDDTSDLQRLYSQDSPADSAYSRDHDRY